MLQVKQFLIELIQASNNLNWIPQSSSGLQISPVQQLHSQHNSVSTFSLLIKG